MKFSQMIHNFLDQRVADAAQAVERIAPRVMITGVYVAQGVRNLLKFDKGILLTYHQLNRAVIEAVDSINGLDLKNEKAYCSDCRIDIVGMFCASFSHHQAAYQLALVGHTLEASIVLRAQIESMLNFLYVVDGEKTHEAVAARVKRYNDWVKVRMKVNMDKSMECNQIFKQLLYSQEYIETVNNNFEKIKSRLGAPVVDKLLKKYSFLESSERAGLAKKFNFKEFYDHLYAESSASVHGADFGDRVRISEEGSSKHVEYHLNFKSPGLYPVLMSNALLYRAAESLVQFFGIESQTLPAFKSAMGAQ